MKYLSILLLTVLCYSCYEDKGNYDYIDINEVHVYLEEMYVATSLYTNVKIEPQYSQTLRDNHDNLRFTWQELSNENETTPIDTLSTAPTLELNINADEPGFQYVRYLRLVVEDTISTLRYITDTKLQVAKPFYKSWMILHEVNNIAQLAAVEYLGGDIKFRTDVFTELTGKSLQGKPITLGVFDSFSANFYDETIHNGFAIVTDRPEESGIYCQWKEFEQMTSFDKMIYPADMAEFDINQISFLGGSRNIEGICLAGGKLYQSIYAGKYYKAHIHPDVQGAIDLVKVGIQGLCPIFYDQAGKRFLYYDNEERFPTAPYLQFDPEVENSTDYVLSFIPEREGNVSEVSLNHITKEQTMLYMGHGYGEGMYDYCTYAIGLGESKCYIYEIINGYPIYYDTYGPSFKAYYEQDSPVGLTKESCLATSKTYNGIFFYTSGNTVYKYDYNTQTAQEIYSHAGSTKAVCMDFAKQQETYLDDDPFMGNNYPMWQQLGIAFQMNDGSYEFVVLHLDITGKVASEGSDLYPSVQVYRGLGKVADIAFV